MSNPLLVLLSLRSRGLWDLAPTITRYRQCLARLRRRKCFRLVRAGIGAIETKLTEDADAWNVHAHLVLDVDDLDVEEVKRVWHELTDGLGTFSPDQTDPCLHRTHVRRLATYATKADTWSPVPGDLDLKRLELLRSAIKGRRLLIEWGHKGDRRGASGGTT